MSAKRNGFSLIEVMVSLVILTVGLIGIFNLHIVSKRGSFEAFQQTQASYYINDIINRMRLNRAELANYEGTYSGSTTAPKSCDVGVGGNSLCSLIETRSWDLYQWERLFQGDNEQLSGKSIGGLDSATACIDINVSDVTVVMTWKGIRGTSDGASAGSSFAKNCGTTSDRRRVLEINTAIL
ncbi:type IV pilus modification protein PilV [Shewanella electrodiphila]|uniref:Type IV pilus modification protein PilV n=1 Tax=Shewanella electrodiphila TaxID=934143 RepID=A0ABT0KJR3_9GAMM|nr:type IV pilus modification protein PilV [Shewanella electrodiphila]MCL1044072.1 type IV pilus modification protein PilV [Shewanella electrodiphila]